MKRNLIWCCLLLFIVSGCDQDDLLIPNGPAVQLNNILGPNEWTEAKIFTINDSLRLRMQQDEESLFIAVDFNKLNLNQYRWVELYIFDSPRMYRFHASGQLGEQQFRLPYWTENWDWGNNTRWTATTQRLAGTDRKSSSNQAYEFKIDKTKFQSRELKLLFHGFSISTQADFDAEPLKYYLPNGSDRYEPDQWLAIRY